MPIPVFNYSAQTPQGDVRARTMLESIQQGLSAGASPFMMMNELKKQQIANALSKVKLKYAPEMEQAELAYKQAMAPHMNAQTNLIGEQAKYYGPNIESEMALRAAQRALTGEQAKYYGPNIQSEIDLRRAQLPMLESEAKIAQFKAQNPLLSLPGVAGQIGAMKYYDQLQNQEGQPQIGENGGKYSPIPRAKNDGQSPLSDMIQDSILAGIKKQNALSELYTKKAQGYDYEKLPKDQRAKLLAQANAMGVNELDASRLFRQGYSIGQIAETQGYDPNNIPEPVYPATGPNVTATQRRMASIEELDYLNKWATEAIAPYSNRIAGYSPKQLFEAISGTNKSGQSNYLAAMALQPEISSLRVKSLQGQVGIEAIREVTNSSMARLRTIQGLVSPDVYRAAQRILDEKIIEASKVANKSMYGLSKLGVPNRMPTEADYKMIAKKRNITVSQARDLVMNAMQEQ